MEELLELANEGGTYDIDTTIEDEDHATVDDSDVSAVAISVQNRDGDYIIEDRAVDAVGTQVVRLTGDVDLQIEDATKKQELRFYTVEATVDSVPVLIEKKFYVKKLHRKTT